MTGDAKVRQGSHKNNIVCVRMSICVTPQEAQNDGLTDAGL